MWKEALFRAPFFKFRNKIQVSFVFVAKNLKTRYENIPLYHVRQIPAR